MRAAFARAPARKRFTRLFSRPACRIEALTTAHTVVVIIGHSKGDSQ